MTSAFFVASKVLWALFSPNNLLLYVFLFILGWVAWKTKGWRRYGSAILSVALISITVLPIGRVPYTWLENRFPVPDELPSDITGVVILGGGIDPLRSRSRNQAQFGGAIDRVIHGVRIAKTHPEALVIYSGGSGQLRAPEATEAPIAEGLIRQLGISEERLRLEGRSRNTYQNATMTFDLASPKPDETWILVTSAAHMPRAVGSFRAAGWDILPYPVDFRTPPHGVWDLSFDFIGGMGWLTRASHEFTGLLFYWLTGRTSSLFPSP